MAMPYHVPSLQASEEPRSRRDGRLHASADDSQQPRRRPLALDEIPTVVVSELSGMEARGYVVANRPYSMKRFVRHPEFARRIVEDYVYIAETDHILLRPIPNLATPEMPAPSTLVIWSLGSRRTLSTSSCRASAARPTPSDVPSSYTRRS